MLERGQRAALAAEPPNDALGVHAAPDDLDGDGLFERGIRPDRAVHGAHSTFADERGDFVRPETAPYERVGTAWRAFRQIHERRVEEVARVGIPGEQRLDFIPQLRVARTLPFQKCGTALRIEVARSLEQGLD